MLVSVRNEKRHFFFNVATWFGGVKSSLVWNNAWSTAFDLCQALKKLCDITLRLLPKPFTDYAEIDFDYSDFQPCSLHFL